MLRTSSGDRAGGLAYAGATGALGRIALLVFLWCWVLLLLLSLLGFYYVFFWGVGFLSEGS